MFMGKTVCKRERKGEDNVVVKVIIIMLWMKILIN